ncbi:MAG: hypothetical protein ABIH26_01805 [Candidatus Eisenbacteria bacterium]
MPFAKRGFAFPSLLSILAILGAVATATVVVVRESRRPHVAEARSFMERNKELEREIAELRWNIRVLEKRAAELSWAVSGYAVRERQDDLGEATKVAVRATEGVPLGTFMGELQEITGVLASEANEGMLGRLDLMLRAVRARACVGELDPSLAGHVVEVVVSRAASSDVPACQLLLFGILSEAIVSEKENPQLTLSERTLERQVRKALIDAAVRGIGRDPPSAEKWLGLLVRPAGKAPLGYWDLERLGACLADDSRVTEKACEVFRVLECRTLEVGAGGHAKKEHLRRFVDIERFRDTPTSRGERDKGVEQRPMRLPEKPRGSGVKPGRK